METDVRQRLGARIKQLRARLRVTQEDLAASSGLHVTYISSVEGGKRNPSVESCAAIAGALGVSLEELFKGV